MASEKTGHPVVRGSERSPAFTNSDRDLETIGTVGKISLKATSLSTRWREVMLTCRVHLGK